MSNRFGDEANQGGSRTAPAYIVSRGVGLPPEPPPQLRKYLAVPPWDQHKIPTAQDFVSFTPTNLALAVGGTVSTTALTGGFFTLPADSIGVLQNVTFSVVGPTATDAFRLTVFENGTPIPGLANVGFPPVVASFFALPINSTWQIAQGATISARFQHVAGVALQVGLFISGNYASAADVFRYTGQRRGQIGTTGDPREFMKHLAR